METNNINNNKNDNNHDITIFNLKGPALKPYGSPVLFQQWSPMPLLILLFDLNNFIISIAIPFLETFVLYKKAFCILGYSVIPCLIKDILPFCGSTDPLFLLSIILLNNSWYCVLQRLPLQLSGSFQNKLQIQAVRMFRMDLLIYFCMPWKSFDLNNALVNATVK